MPVMLMVRDGLPDWWESPDIWVVPGSDPNGPPGQPLIGQPAYLWAHVANTGDTDATNVQVDFWVANPSLQIRRSTASHIGSAFADIPAGTSQDVLCLVPWHVQLVNGGHECVVVEASVSSDPLIPPPSDPDLLDAPSYPQIAQHNLSVATPSPLHHIVIGVHAGPRASRQVTVEAHIGGDISREALRRLGLTDAKPARAHNVRIVLSHHSLCGRELDQGESSLNLDVASGTSAPVFLAIEQIETLDSNEYEVVKLVERSNGRVEGGISFVLLSAIRKGGHS